MRHSDSLLRVKGFLSFVEQPKPHLVNIVHDVCNIEPLERDAQGSYLVFIGIGLPETEIRKDLETCFRLQGLEKVCDVRNAMRVKAPELCIPAHIYINPDRSIGFIIRCSQDLTFHS